MDEKIDTALGEKVDFALGRTLDKLKGSHNSNECQQFAQAALNLANVKHVLASVREFTEINKKPSKGGSA